MIEVTKSKDGKIEEISDIVTVRKHGSHFIVLPNEFFTIGKLPWKNPDKVKVSLKLNTKKPRIHVEEPEQDPRPTLGTAMAGIVAKKATGMS